MNENEAIEQLKYISEHFDYSRKQREAAEMVIKAFWKNQEREKGCEYCNTKRIQSAIGFKQFKYCPICGRKLGKNDG